MTDNWLLRDIIVSALNAEASDIHIQTGAPVFFRIHGIMTTQEQFTPSRAEVEEMLTSLMKTDGALAGMYDKEEYDLSYAMPLREGVKRFRVNISLCKEGIYIVMRQLKKVDPKPLEIGVPKPLIDLVENIPYGLIFIAGPTGSGKSTTLASVISYMAINSSSNIVTIEDPIEYEIISANSKSNVVQREVHKHTLAFDRGIRAAMRQDPDIILVGEVRDPETSVAAIQAAKTGHTVFATIHTSVSSQIPARVISMFQPERQSWVMNELMESMVCGMVQALVPTVTGKRVLVTEFLDLTSPDTRMLIRDSRLDKVKEKMMAKEIGWTLNMDLAEFVKKGVVSKETAYGYTNDLDDIRRILP